MSTCPQLPKPETWELSWILLCLPHASNDHQVLSAAPPKLLLNPPLLPRPGSRPAHLTWTKAQPPAHSPGACFISSNHTVVSKFFPHSKSVTALLAQTTPRAAYGHGSQSRPLSRPPQGLHHLNSRVWHILSLSLGRGWRRWAPSDKSHTGWTVDLHLLSPNWAPASALTTWHTFLHLTVTTTLWGGHDHSVVGRIMAFEAVPVLTPAPVSMSPRMAKETMQT